MSGCESVRGEWGDICPDCGQRLPDKTGPLTSWMAARAPEERTTWLIPVRIETRERRGGGHQSEGRDMAMLEATLRCEGNRTRAAEAEGVTVSFVSHALKRLADAGDERAILLRRERGSAHSTAHLTERQQECLRILVKHAGNRHAAARELGITSSSMFSFVSRARARGVAVPV